MPCRFLPVIRKGHTAYLRGWDAFGTFSAIHTREATFVTFCLLPTYEDLSEKNLF